MDFISRVIVILFFIGLLIRPPVYGQSSNAIEPINANLLELSSMTIIGSSTLHDWEVEATDFSVQFLIPGNWFASEESWSGEDVSELVVTVPVSGLDGGKNKMNRDLRDALRYPEYEEIQFFWDEIRLAGEMDTGRKVDVTGRLFIAGEERDISFDSVMSLNEWSQLVVKGSVQLNMTDFNVEPPKVLFGVIRTDEIVDLSFELFFGNQ